MRRAVGVLLKIGNEDTSFGGRQTRHYAVLAVWVSAKGRFLRYCGGRRMKNCGGTGR